MPTFWPVTVSWWDKTGTKKGKAYVCKTSEDANKLAKYLRERLFRDANVMEPLEAENKTSALTRVIIPFYPSELCDGPKFIWLAKRRTPKTILHFFYTL